MTTELDNVRSLGTLISVMGGISNSYKQFFPEYPLKTFTRQIDDTYLNFKNKLESSGFVMHKTELDCFTDFEYSITTYYSRLANDSNCFEVINFLTMFFYSKCEKEGRYKDLLNQDYAQLYTEVDSMIKESRDYYE